MKRAFLYGVFVCSLVSPVFAQTPDTVIPGPNGVPRMVKDEGGGWSIPIQIYSDADRIVYVPDITTPGWAQWHVRMFKDKGEYFTLVYTYLKKARNTTQDTLYVNVNTHHAIVLRFLKPPLKIDLQTATPGVVQTTANITKLVSKSIAQYKGPSIEDTARQQREAAARMVQDTQIP